MSCDEYDRFANGKSPELGTGSFAVLLDRDSAPCPRRGGPLGKDRNEPQARERDGRPPGRGTPGPEPEARPSALAHLRSGRRRSYRPGRPRDPSAPEDASRVGDPVRSRVGPGRGLGKRRGGYRRSGQEVGRRLRPWTSRCPLPGQLAAIDTQIAKCRGAEFQPGTPISVVTSWLRSRTSGSLTDAADR
jgi:hypothetical protein